MKNYIPPGAYRKHGHIRPIKKPAWQQLDALLDLIPKDKSVIDIGCHQGVYAKLLEDKGYQTFGIDGIPTIEKDTEGFVKWCDLTQDCSKFYSSADWGLFFEVGEHIPQDFEGILFDNVCAIPREGLVVSWCCAGIGVGKHRHINCHTQVYVASEFARRGWFVNDEETIRMREIVNARVLLKERIMVLRK